MGWGNHFAYVDWIAKNCPFLCGCDPIPAWSRRAERLCGEKKPHKALKKCRSFLDDTAALREHSARLGGTGPGNGYGHRVGRGD